MLLGSKQRWRTLEDEDSPKPRKTNRNNVLLEDNVSSESEEEFLCQKHQKPGKLNIDFEVNITPNMTDKYNNEKWICLKWAVEICKFLQLDAKKSMFHLTRAMSFLKSAGLYLGWTYLS